MGHLGMVSNMNFPAPLAALGFLGACAGVILAACSLITSAFIRKGEIARIALAVLVMGAAVYLGMLFGFSLLSHDRLLSRGQEKYFCEIDCHLAYSVLEVRTEPAGATTHYAVTLRTRFDETTISSHRPKGMPLEPAPRTVELVDADGNHYLPDSANGASLSASLIPGQSYITQISFRVPSGARDLRLLLHTTPWWPARVFIGDENSWLHHKTYFAL